jgi:hypothetical protein
MGETCDMSPGGTVQPLQNNDLTNAMILNAAPKAAAVDLAWRRRCGASRVQQSAEVGGHAKVVARRWLQAIGKCCTLQCSIEPPTLRPAGTCEYELQETSLYDVGEVPCERWKIERDLSATL